MSIKILFKITFDSRPVTVTRDVRWDENGAKPHTHTHTHNNFVRLFDPGKNAVCMFVTQGAFAAARNEQRVSPLL